MLKFLKKETFGLYDYGCLVQDLHCHLLPGIDDGSPDIATSIQLLQGLIALGFKKFVCTPHIISDLYRNTPETILPALSLLQKACREHQLPVQLEAAAEYMMDDYFMDLLRNKSPLLTLQGNYVLTELSYATPPGNLEKIAFELITNGYQPLMAHPERYFYYHKNFNAYHRMKELGFMLQVNMLSLCSYYGKPAAKAARYIIENDLVDFIGTDLHHFNHLKALTNPRNREIFQSILGNRILNKFDVPKS